MRKSPAYIELERIQAAKEISALMGRSRNRLFLEADTLLMNLTGKFDTNLEKSSVSASDIARAQLK